MGTKTDPFTDEKHFTPNSVNRELMKQLFVGVNGRVKELGKSLLLDHGYKFYVVTQSRGRCYMHDKIITIPDWVLIKKPIDYKDWYIAHEMAHAYQYIEDRFNDVHGPRFMAKLIEICPANALHYEIGYKPRNAIAAGIRMPRNELEDNADRDCGF